LQNKFDTAKSVLPTVATDTHCIITMDTCSLLDRVSHFVEPMTAEDEPLLRVDTGEDGGLHGNAVSYSLVGADVVVELIAVEEVLEQLLHLFFPVRVVVVREFPEGLITWSRMTGRFGGVFDSSRQIALCDTPCALDRIVNEAVAEPHISVSPSGHPRYGKQNLSLPSISLLLMSALPPVGPRFAHTNRAHRGEYVLVCTTGWRQRVNGIFLTV
jgi:hypothetical protein